MNRTWLITCTIVIGVIITGFVLLANSTMQSGEKKERSDTLRYPQFPESVNTELVRLNKEKPFVVNRWEIDKKNKQILLYVLWMNQKQIDELQNKKVGNWNVTVFTDTEMMKELDLVRAEMQRLEKDPGMQIAASEMGVGDGRIEIFVYLYNYTPANRELLKSGIRGWKVDGGPVAAQPLTSAEAKK